MLFPHGDPCGAQLTEELRCPGDPTQIPAAVTDPTIGVGERRHLRDNEMALSDRPQRNRKKPDYLVVGNVRNPLV